MVGLMDCLVVVVEVNCGGVLCLGHPGAIGRSLSSGLVAAVRSRILVPFDDA